MALRSFFLNVGNGDCTIVELPDGRFMVVDICNGRRNRSDANLEFKNSIHYLSKLNVNSIYRYVQSHPDMDHMDGLSDLSTMFPIYHFWDTKNTRQKPDEFSHGFREQDWEAYQTLRSGTNKEVRRLFNTRSLNSISPDEGKYQYGIYVISPTKSLVDRANSEEDWNLLSYVILLEYEDFKLLLGGDASDEAWEDVYEWTNNDSDARQLLSGITVFRVSHHGRNSSYCGAEMLNLMKPKHIVISKSQVQGDVSAYGKYYNWVGGADNMYLTSKGTVLADYSDIENRKYSIKYV